MISYDNYKNRIEKLAKFKRVVHKFRFLICGVLALIVGTSVGLMCAKGAYMSDMTLSAQTVNFNEYYEVTAAKAFLASPSEQHIEYRNVTDGGDWTTAKPVKAGAYAARTVTKKIVGYSYSSEVNFEILPLDAEFTITGTSVTYGDAPSFSVPQLVAGHRVEESALEFTYGTYGAPSTEVNVVASSVKIVDASGDDFSGCYNFVNYSGKTLDIGKRNITVKPVDYQFTYDAQPHNSGDKVADETLTRLVSGDTLTVTTSLGGGLAGGAVDADNYTVRLESVSIMHGADDVSDWYNVSYGTSQFTIEKRPLTVTTGDAVKVYDGTPAENTKFESANLVEGHTATVDTSTLPAYTNVGTYSNEFGVKVSDGTTDVSRNYEVKCNAGTLTINPAKLTVTTRTPAAAHTYDGTPFEYYYFDVAETLSAGFKITAVERLAQDTTDAGVYDNDFKVAVTLNGLPVTDNFEIAYTLGKLTVLKRNLTVTTVGNEKVFDGTPLTYSNCYGDDLAENQRLKEVKSFSVTDVTAADGVEIAAVFTVVDFAGRDVGKNYNIGYENGKLIITPRHIVVTTNSKTREYDGTPLSDGGYTTDILGGGLFNGDKLVLKGAPAEITERGFIDNANDYTVPSANYVIDDIIYGTLRVETKKVTVNISDVTAVYGEEITVPDNSFGLISGETLTFTTHFERGGTTHTPETWHGYTLLNVGTYSIVPDADKIVTGGNANLDNYDIKYVNGTLEITKRVVYYVTADAEKVYDGTYLQNTDYTTYLAADNTKAGLLGDSDELSLRPDITRIIGVERRLNINYYDCPANYVINMEMSAANFGWLEITPRPIIVYTGSATKPYDGTPLTCGDYTVKYASEVGGKWVADDSEVGLVTREDTGIRDTLTLKGNAVSITDAGEIENASKYANGNYDIKDYVNGTLKIEKYKVNFALSYMRDQYGKQNVLEQFGMTYADALVNGELLEIIHKFKQNGEFVKLKDVGTYVTVADGYKVYSASGEIIENGENNYDIEFSDGEYKILPRPVTVDINDGTAVYGDDVSANEYGFVTDPAELPYNEKLTITYKYDREVGDVGDYDIFADKVFIDGKEVDPNNCNYAFNFNAGTLFVTQKAIYTYIKAKSCVYGDDLPEIEWWISYGDNLNTENVPVTELPYGDTVELEGFLYYKLENREPCGWHSAKPRLNAGKYIVGYNSWDIRNTDGDRCEDNYYVFSGFNDGLLTVTPAPLKVTLADITGVYGDEITYPAEQTVVEGLKYNQTLSFEVKYADGDGNFVVPKNAGQYAVFTNEDTYEVTEEDGAEGLISNYTVTFESGTLTIGKMQVHIRLKDRTVKYGDEMNFAWYVPQMDALDFERVDGSDQPVLAYDEVFIAKLGYKDGNKVLNQTNNSWRLSVDDYTMYVVEYSIGYVANPSTVVEIIDGIANYDIECKEGTLTVEPYAVTVKPNDQTCVYGTPEDEIEDTGFEYTDSLTINQGGLPYGEELILSYTYDPSPVTDVGTYAIKATATGVEGGDLTNYAVEYEDGELTVTKKTIWLVIDDKDCYYGDDLPKVTYKIAEDYDGEIEITLPHGDRFVPAEFVFRKLGAPASSTPKNVGKYTIFPSRSGNFMNGDTDVSDNYDLKYYGNAGILTINKKTVTVELSDIAPVYYGETFTYAAGVDNYANFDTIQLAYDERLKVAVEYLIDGKIGTPKNANQYGGCAYSARLKADACTVYEADGETVVESGVDNYNFICEDLEDLIINARQIRIYLNDLDDVQYGDAVVYPDELNNFKRIEDLSGDGFEGVPYGEQFKVEVYYNDKNNEKIENPVDVGVYTVHSHLTATTVYESDGVTEIDGGYENYRIVFGKGSVKIVPRKITIQLNSYEMEYGDFEEFDYPDRAGNYDIDNSDPLAYGQTLEVGFNREFIYKKLIDGEYKEVTPKDVGTYVITFKEGDYAIYDGNETYYDGSYDIEFIPGTLTITKKKIAVKLDDISCTYGDELPEHTYKIYESLGSDTEYTLPYGDKFAITGYWYTENRVLVTPKNAGSYGIGISTHTFTNTDGEDVSANYSYNYYGGTLTINKADLEITLPDITGLKYGDEWTYPYEDCLISGLRNSEALEVAVKFVDGDGNFVTPKNAGTYTVVLDEDNCKITNEDGTAGLLSNYEIDCEDVEFDIAKREITVYLKADKTNIYYGDDLPEVTFTISESDNEEEEYTLPYSDEITFDYKYLNLWTNEYETPKNVGTYQVDIEKTFVNGVLQTKDNSNYTVGYYDVWITIRPYGFHPVIDDFSVVYGNEIPYYFGASAEETERLPYGEEVIVEVKYLQNGVEVTPVNKGVYDIEIIDYIVYDKDGVEIENGADNYGFYPELGQMTITALEVTITVNDLTATYGDDLTELENGFTVDIKMPYGEQFELSYSCDIGNPNAGEYESAITATVVGVTGGNADIDNYDIKQVIAGNLIVSQRGITVTVKGGKAVYGDELPEIRHEITDGETVSGETLVPAYKFSLNGTECDPINAGAYDISIDVDNTTVEGGNALYKNYAVTYVYDGKLVITPAPLTVEIIGDSFTYGERAANVGFKITDGALYYDDQLKLTYAYDGKSDEPTAAGTYVITATAAIVGGNARIENYDIPEIASVTLTISQREIEITLDATVNSFAYGDDFDGEICAAAIVGGKLDNQTVIIAVTYAPKSLAARARSFLARAAQGFTPKAVGEYTATLDFDNCAVVDKNGNPVEGGIGNYKLESTVAPVDFEITPLNITVEIDDGEITYGDKLPTALSYNVAEEMPYGESLALTFSFAGEDDKLPVHKGDYPVTVTAEITGGDIGNYRLEYANGNPTLTIKAKTVKIRLGSLTRSYGGEIRYEIKEDNYDTAASDVLIDGDVLTVTEVKYIGADGTEYDAENPPVNVGRYAIVYVSCSIVNADGEDVTADYTVKDEDGVLLIDSSVITVYTASAEKEYDGTALSTDKYSRYDGDLGDYYLVVDEDNICERIDATDGNGVDNTTKFKIVDEDGNETTNLKLEYGSYGKLKVTPKYVEVTIDNTSAVYGEQPEITGTTSVPLVGEEKLGFEVEYRVGVVKVTPDTDGGYFRLPVGNYRMYYVQDSAYIEGGRANVANYDLQFALGAAFEVTPRLIAIMTATDEHEYDGCEFFNSDGYVTKRVVGDTVTDEAGLLGGDGLEVLGYTSLITVDSVANVCSYEASDNYEIVESKYVYGTLTVKGRAVTAKTADVNARYDGKPHSSGVVTDVDNRLAEGHEFRVTGALVAPVDVCKNVENKLTVIIVDTNDNDRDVTANYLIKPDYGKITITARPLEITTGGVDDVTYDGKPHGNTDYEKADGLLTELGHELVVDRKFTRTDATEGVDNDTTYKVYCDGKDLTGNYEINYEKGKIVIKKAPVTVRLNENVEVQYGDNSYVRKLTENAVTLVNGETVTLAVKTATVGGVGTYTAEADWENSVFSKKNGANNYQPEFEPQSVKFKVIPRTVTVTLNAGGKTQFAYGADYDSAMRTVTTSWSKAGEVIEAAVTYDEDAPKNVGTYTATLDVENCTVRGGDKANYDIVSGGDVTFTITPKDLTVYMSDLTVGFDEPIAYPDGDAGYYNIVGLLDGESIEVTPAFRKNGVAVAPRYAGEYDIVCGSVIITDEDGNAVDADNYNVVNGKPYGKLTIEGISVVIKRLAVEKVYDGEPVEVTANDIIYTVNGVEGGSLDGNTLIVDSATAPANVNVGTTKNTTKYIIVDGDGEIARNYVITYEENDEAVLKIKPLPVNVEVADMTKTYGEAVDDTFSVDLIKTEKLLYKIQVNGDVTYPLNVDGYEITGVTVAVSDNYEITYTTATLEVTKRSVAVKVADMTKVYGEEIGETQSFDLINGETLTFRVLYDNDGGEFVVGTYGIKADGDVTKMTVSGGNGSADNYEFTFSEDAELNVTKRTVTVTTADIDGTYNGQYHSNSGVEADENLLSGHQVLADGVFRQYDAVENGENRFAVKIVDGEGVDKTANYTVNCDYGKVNIKKCNLNATLTSDGAAHVYDGDAHEFDTTACGLIATLLGEDGISAIAVRYSLDEDGKQIISAPVNAGTYYVLLDTDNTTVSGISGEKAISANYVVTCGAVEFVISPAKIKVTLNSGGQSEFTYGDNYDTAMRTVTVEGMVGDETFIAAVTYGEDNPRNAGTYTAELDAENCTVDGGDINNYEIVKCDGVTFRIAEKNIIITVKDRSVEADDAEYSKSDISGGFVSGDFAKVEIEAFTYYKDGVKLDGVPGDIGTYTVSVELGGEIMGNYNVTEVKAGTLTITERKVLVTPVFKGTTPYVYDGNAVDLNLFGFVHSHDVAGGAGEPGFLNNDEDGFDVTYTFTDANGNKIDGAPKNAGTYSVDINLSGGKTGQYSITYETVQFTIDMRGLSYTLKVVGASEFVYSNKCPDLKDELELTATGFVDGEGGDYTFELFDGETLIERYNVGTYQVKIRFQGMDNYDITATAAQITITPRTIVVTPTDRYDGVPREYDGTNLKLRGSDFEIKSVTLENGDIADGDEITIKSTELSPTLSVGTLKIEKVTVRDEETGEDVTFNYTVYSTYNANNPTIKSLGLRSTDFQVRVAFVQSEIHYTLGEVGKTFPYTGNRVTYTFDADGAASLSDGETLGFGHRIAVTQNSVSVPAAAGEYPNLITNLVSVVDGNGNKMAIYTLVCDNPEKGVIKVAENVVSVDLSGLTQETADGLLNIGVTFEDGASECESAVYAFDIDGRRLIGITLYSENSAGKQTDLSANYKLDESCTLDWAEVAIITLAEAEEYSRPALGVKITVTETELERGKGSLYTYTEGNRWVLNGGYTVDGDLLEGHELEVLVFIENGEYLLGVTVYRVENGSRKDARNSYRLRDLVKSDVEARYIAASETDSLKREIYVDFSGCTIEEGEITGYTVEGLNTAGNHVIEVTATENEDGTYTLAVVIYQLRRQGSTYKKFNMGTMYELKATAPEGVTAGIVSGTLN